MEKQQLKLRRKEYISSVLKGVGREQPASGRPSRVAAQSSAFSCLSHWQAVSFHGEKMAFMDIRL